MRARIPRLLAVIFIYLLMFCFLFAVFYFFLPSVLEDIVSFTAQIPVYLNTLNHMGVFEDYANILGISAPTNLSTTDLLNSLKESLSLSGVFGNTFSAAASVFGGVFSFILIIVFSFYFTMIHRGVDDFLVAVTPPKYRAYILDLWARSKKKIGLWMQGQLLLGVIMGVLVYLTLTILGIRHSLLLAILAAVFELIPVFGPTLAAVPAVLIGFVDGGATTGLLIIALYVILQQFENHLIYPLVVTKVVGVPPLVVIMGLIIGAKVFGFLGILLSVPVAATLQELVRDMAQRKSFASDET
jgi:predicted PurR-regulated permease PerM